MSFFSIKTKVLSSLGTAALLATSTLMPFVSAEEGAAYNFTDVAPRYELAVKYVVENKISNGISNTQFGISKEIIRGDAAIMIARAAALVDEKNEVPASGFLDIPDRGVSAINGLKAAGVINGKTETKFDFYGKITRGEAAIMLAKAFALNGENSTTPFTDVNGTRYESAVAALVENKVTSGTTSTQYGTFRNIQRGEFAIFFERLDQKLVVDTEAPVLEYKDNTSIILEVDDEFSMPIVKAVDNKDESVEVLLSITDETGKEILPEDFTTSMPGNYRFNYTAIDQAGNKSAMLSLTVKISSPDTPTEPVKEFTFLEINKPYVSSDNTMTVTMEKLEVIDNGDFYEINLTYREKNNTTDQAIDQGAFKIYYVNGESEPQYGFFDKLYPGEEAVRNYTFKALNSQDVKAIEYGADLFFKEKPTEETLKWIVDSPVK